MPNLNKLQNPEQLNGLSVDFGGTKISAARVVRGQIADYLESKTDGGAAIDSQIAQIINLLDRLGITANDKIAVALAGRVTKQGVWQAVNSKTLSDIGNVPLKQILENKLSRPVNIQNDATAAVVGEYILGAAKGYDRAAFITISTGVGGGIILGGRPMISETGLAGHIGFTTSRSATEICGSGRQKTVESVASGNAIAAIAQKNGHAVKDGKAVFEAHLAGEVWATKIITSSEEVISELCANLTSILGLDIITIGGSVGLAEGYLALVQQAQKQEPEIFRPKLVKAELGRNAALLGILADVY